MKFSVDSSPGEIEWMVKSPELFQSNEMSHYHQTYSLFHSSLPFGHLGQPSLCVNQVFLFYFRTETVSQVPGDFRIYSAVCHLF